VSDFLRGGNNAAQYLHFFVTLFQEGVLQFGDYLSFERQVQSITQSKRSGTGLKHTLKTTEVRYHFGKR
jgi:hypothetical protein